MGICSQSFYGNLRIRRFLAYNIITSSLVIKLGSILIKNDYVLMTY